LADRSPLGDLDQSQSLFFGEFTVEMNGAMKMVDHRLLPAAGLFMPKFDCVQRSQLSRST